MTRRRQDDSEFERFRCQRHRERMQRESGRSGLGGGPNGHGGGMGGFGGGEPGYDGGPPGYGGIQPGYGGGAPGYGGAPQGYGGSPQGYGGSPQGYGGSPQGYGGGRGAFGREPSGPVDHQSDFDDRSESKETRDQRISNDVRDFFAEATRQAKIVAERVAEHVAEQVADEAAVGPTSKVEQEVASFLLDAVERMNDFVVGRLVAEVGVDEERDIAPTVANIVGDMLDEFRESGTASTDDKHVGKDPFLVSVSDVQRGFREKIASLRATEEAPAAVASTPTASAVDQVSMVDVDDDDGVATEYDEDEQVEPPPAPTRPKPTAVEPEAAVPAAASTTAEPVELTAAASLDASQAAAADVAAPSPEASVSAAPAPAEAAVPPVAPPPKQAHDLVALARLKQALKAMVQNGTMTREEAIAVWRKRVDGG